MEEDTEPEEPDLLLERDQMADFHQRGMAVWQQHRHNKIRMESSWQKSNVA